MGSTLVQIDYMQWRSLSLGILCCLIHILNSLLGSNEGLLRQSVGNNTEQGLAENNHDDDAASRRRLEAGAKADGQDEPAEYIDWDFESTHIYNCNIDSNEEFGYFDEEGLLYIVDRIKELIKYKGFQDIHLAYLDSVNVS
nr:protein spirrig [Ipomoea batatas]